ncbi:MAG: chemotaxis protein CheX [Armatimonadetes bacterium]|nr:chemotaxis protein CheX [Armatimonadota bacterium]
MKVEYVSPFANAAIAVSESLLKTVPERGDLAVRPKLFTSQQVSIVCGVTGSIEGHVIYGMSMATADKIASIMIGQSVVTFDQIAASALAELANLISRNAVSRLAEQGFKCEITPPTILRGSNVQVSLLEIPALVIPLNSEAFGMIEIGMSLQDRQLAA